MTRFLISAAAALILTALPSLAQFEGGPRYDSHSVTVLVERVHTDLNHAYASWRFSHDDRDRLNHAEEELRDFAKKWDRGHFDKDELDGAIGAVQHVLDNNKLPELDRDAISGDVSQLRRMREAYDRHEIGGTGRH